MFLAIIHPAAGYTYMSCMYIRSLLEKNFQVWNFSISEEEKQNLERVQKFVCKIILNSRYSDYEDALYVLNLESLEKRREVIKV